MHKSMNAVVAAVAAVPNKVVSTVPYDTLRCLTQSEKVTSNNISSAVPYDGSGIARPPALPYGGSPQWVQD